MKLKKNLFIKYFIHGTILLVLNSNAIFAQCDECIDKEIVVFDLRIDVPTLPDSSTQVLFHKLSSLIRKYSRETDPSRDCFTWVDGGMWTSIGTGYTPPVDPSAYNTAPYEPISSAAYILAGGIYPAGTDHVYSLIWRVECGTSREIVLSSNYTFSTDSSWDYIDVVAQLATAGLQPLQQVIQDFEIKKRDEDVEIARSSSGSIIITPRKTTLHENDSTEVDLELFDECDGVVLKNREIILEPYTDPFTGEKLCNGPSGGTVHPVRVTTDENGKAKVTFVAGSGGGLGIINAVYPYKKPYGWKEAMTGQAAINLTTSMVQVDIVFMHNSSSSTNATTIEGENTTKSTGDSYFKVIADLKFVYEVKDPNSIGKDKLIVTTDDPATGIVHGLNYMGNYREGGTTRIEKWDGEGNMFAWYFSQSSFSGQRRRSLLEPGLYASFTPDAYMYFQMSGTMDRYGWAHENISGFPDGGAVNMDGFFTPVNVSFTEIENEAHFTIHGPPFQASYHKTATTNEPGTSSTYEIIVIADFKGNPVLNSVEGNFQRNLPEKFVLYQNYPNPFNPSTAISFSLPTKIFVSLDIYDILGRKAATIVSGQMSAGNYVRYWNASGFPSGVYFYRLKAGTFTETKKLLLLE